MARGMVMCMTTTIIRMTLRFEVRPPRPLSGEGLGVRGGAEKPSSGAIGRSKNGRSSNALCRHLPPQAGEGTFVMLEYDFMRTAFMASGVAAVLAGTVGYFLVLRGQTFAGHALSHVGFTGATGALLFGLSPLAGLVCFTFVAGIRHGPVRREARRTRRGDRHDPVAGARPRRSCSCISTPPPRPRRRRCCSAMSSASTARRS